MSSRKAFTNDQKQQICLYKKNNLLFKDKDVGVHFAILFTNVNKIPKSTLSRILSESNTYLTNKLAGNCDKRFRIRGVEESEKKDVGYISDGQKLKKKVSTLIAI